MFSCDAQGGIKKTAENRGHQELIQDIVWHPTKENAFFTASKDKTVKLWDIKEQKGLSQPVYNEKTKEENLHLAISPDGNTLAVCSSREEITFYDMRNWKTLK
jgi:WD40 repeat protein